MLEIELLCSSPQNRNVLESKALALEGPNLKVWTPTSSYRQTPYIYFSVQQEKALMKPDTFDTDNLSLALTKEQRTLETTSYDYTVDYLISLIKEGQMILEKPVEPLWKTEKASKLIESLLMNFPISLLYLIEHEKWLVVDGKQRLFAIFNFHQNQYKLTALEIVKEFENNRFNDLPPKAKRLINFSVMHIVLIRRNSHPGIVSNMMKRLKS